MAIDGFSALIGSLVAGTLKATATRAVAPRLHSIGSREVSNISRNWRLPENHDAQKALRTAQFEAVLNTLSDFEAWAAKDDTTALSADEQRFVDSARSDALAQKRAANKPEKHLDAAGMQRLAKSLDLALAGKMGLDERADALRLAASQAVLADVARSVARAAGIGVPDRFRAIFIGELRHVEGWHPRFVAFASQALKDKPAYRDIFIAEKLCVISDRLEGLHEAVTTGFQDISGQMSAMHSDLMDRIARDKGVPPENLRPLFGAVGQDVPDANFEQAVRQAVDELLARAQQKPHAFNDPEEIRRAIEVARDKLSRLDTDGAVEHLRQVFAEEEELLRHRAQGASRLKLEEAEILESAYRFDEAIAAFEAAGRLDPHNAWTWFKAGDIHVHRGRLAAAFAAFERGRTVADGVDDERSTMVGLNRGGDVVLRLGNGDAAIAAYRKGLAIAEALAARDPANTEWQRDLSVSHNKIGDVELRLGNGDAALDAYRKGLAIAETLDARDPENTEWQRDLSVSHDKIGDVEQRLGNGDAALAAYRESHLILKALAARDPANTEWQRDLSVSHNKIGNVELRLGNYKAALAAYRKSLSIRKVLAARDPANTEWQRDLSVSHNKIGNVELRLDKGKAALAAYRKGLKISEALALCDPANTEWQRDLSVAHNKIGDVELQLGNGDAALEAYQRDLAIAEALANRDPANAEWQRDLSISHDRIGDVELRLDNDDAALTAYRKGLAIREALAARDPANAEWQRDLIVSNVKLAESGGDARTHLEAALAIATRLVDEGRLAPDAAWMVDALRQRLAAAG